MNLAKATFMDTFSVSSFGDSAKAAILFLSSGILVGLICATSPSPYLWNTILQNYFDYDL
jgi:hypothetical protein